MHGWTGICCALALLGGGVHGAAAATAPGADPGADPAPEVPLLATAVPSPRARGSSGLFAGAARAALRAGYPGMARQLAGAALADPDLAQAEQAALTALRISAAIAEGDLAAARTWLAAVAAPDAGLRLRAAIVAFAAGERARAAELLDSILPAQLTADDRPWWWLLDGMRRQAAGDFDGAVARFSEAARSTAYPVVRGQFELLRLRQDLLAGPPAETVVSGLRETARNLQGELGGFEAARLLAIALAQGGRGEEAVQIIDRQLQLPGLGNSGLRPHFLLLLGLVSGEQGGRGRLALSQLVNEAAGERHVLEAGLQLLARAAQTPASRLELLQELGGWLDPARPPHPLRDQMLALRAILTAAEGNLAQAEADALLLIENFPGSPWFDDALRLLAWTAWQRPPARYRTAADYLARLRQRLPAGAERSRLGVLIADCYFLNGDYLNAADAYASALREAAASEQGTLIFQRALAEIRAGRHPEAAAILDAAHAGATLGDEALWQAEWNLLDALKRADRLTAALERVTRLQGAAAAARLPPALGLRFAWIEARLLLETGASAAASRQAEALLARLGDAAWAPELDPGLRANVVSHTLLILGEARLRAGDPAGARSVFAELRERFAGSGPAILSYLVEARAAAASDALVGAQQALIQLADLFPQSRYAPVALWEAAIHAEQRGLNPHLQEAIVILERLAADYPGHPLVFYARLKQGDLARRLNDYGTALLLYERLLNLFPDHPESFRAELSRADCLFAQGSQDRNRLEDAALAFERLTLLAAAPADLRVEAGLKWATAQRLRGADGESRAALWVVVHTFLPGEQRDTPPLGNQGRYWLARVVFELAGQLEQAGDATGAQRLYRSLIAQQLPGAALARSRLP